MSTLRVTNVQDTAGANSLTTAQIYNGAAKAWVNFNGTGTVAIRASYNVSSITDNGTGNYTVNFATAMPDANYSAAGAVRNNITNFSHMADIAISTSAGPTSTAFRFDTGWGDVNNNNYNRADCDIVNLSFFR